jgi:hypothetical protein
MIGATFVVAGLVLLVVRTRLAAERRDLYVLDDCVFVLAPFPKFGLRLMHAATTCGSICGKALPAFVEAYLRQWVGCNPP